MAYFNFNKMYEQHMSCDWQLWSKIHNLRVRYIEIVGSMVIFTISTNKCKLDMFYNYI
jgi:hypothetical protein